MNVDHDPFAHMHAESLLRARARTAYELGRLRAAVMRAALLALSTALFGTWLIDRGAWVWAPLSFAAWCAVWWRGGAALRAAHFGLVAGATTLLLPLAVLRPCCFAGMQGGAVVCTMPEMCVFAGALVGMPLAIAALRRSGTQRAEAALGLLLGAVPFASIKCSALAVGESIGLIAGLALGIAAVTATSLAERPA